MANETTTKFKVDISELKKEMQEAKRQVKLADAEFKAVSSSMEDWTKTSDGLQAKLKSLDTKLVSQKTVLNGLEKQYELTVKEMGEGSKEADNLRLAIFKQQAVVNETQKEIKKYEEAFDSLGNEMDETTGKTEKSTDGFTVFKGVLSNLVTEGISLVVSGLKDATKEVVNLAFEVAKAGDEIDKESQKLQISSDLYQELAYACERSGSSIDNLTKGIKNITDKMADAQNGVEGATTNFDALGVSLRDNYGRYKSTEDMLLDVIDALGNMSDETQRNALANDIFGRSASELLPLLNSGSAGIKELMDEAKAYGMVMSEDAVSASATFEDSLTRLQGTFNGLKNSIISEALPAITDIMDALSLLLAGDDTAGDKLKEGVNNALTSIGEMIKTVIPIVTDMAQTILELLPDLLSEIVTSVIGALPTLIKTVLNVATELIKTIVGMLPDLINTVLELVSMILKTLGEVIPDIVVTVLKIVPEIVKALLNAIPTLIQGAIEFLMAIIEAVPEIIKALGEAIPEIINSILTILGGSSESMMKVFKSLFSTIFTVIPQIIASLADVIPQIIKAIINYLMGNMSMMITTYVQLFSALIEALPEIITMLINVLPELIEVIIMTIVEAIPALLQGAVQFFMAIVEAIPPVIKALVKTLPQLIGAIIDGFKGLPDKLKDIGSNAVKGLWNGIKDMTSWIHEKIKGFGESVVNGLKDFFGIHSPSKLMADEIGKYIPQGIAVGIDKNAKSVMSSMKNLTAGAVNSLGTVTGGAGGVVNNYTQVINSPKQLSRLDIYRQSKNLLGYVGGGF